MRFQGCLGTVVREISAVDGVSRLAWTDGSADIMVEILAMDDDELLQQVNEIRRIKGVSNVEIFVHLKNLKRAGIS